MVANQTDAPSVGEITAEGRHDAPRAADRCDLWATLRTRDNGAVSRIGLTRGAQSMFLHFRASGLLLALPDEGPALLDQEPGTVSIPLHRTDALGLGLHPTDMESGVGVCGADGPGPLDGWQCCDVVLMGVDEHGRESPLAGPADFSNWLA